MKGSTTRTIRYNKEPVPGKDAVVYMLIPSHTSVAVRTVDGEKVASPSSLTFRVTRKAGEDSPVTVQGADWAAQGIKVKYTLAMPTSSLTYTYQPGSSVTVDTGASSLTASLLVNDVEVAAVTVSFITYGEDGKDAVAMQLSQSSLAYNNRNTSVVFIDFIVNAGGAQVDLTGSVASILPLRTAAGESLDSKYRNIPEQGDWCWQYSTQSGHYGYRLLFSKGSDPSGQYACGLRYGGRDYILSLSVENVFDGTNGTNGTNGVNGHNGVWVPPPMQWLDYPADYMFLCGDVDEGETRMDIVVVRHTADGATTLLPYRCRVSHGKTATNNPMNDAYDPALNPDGYWELCDAGVYRFLATDLLLAANAQISFLSGQAIRVGDSSGMCGYFGAPTSGAILYTGASSVAEATYVVFSDGRARWGSASGRRIELNPADGSLRMYDGGGELRYTLTGETIDVGTAVPGDSQTKQGQSFNMSASKDSASRTADLFGTLTVARS